jgi:hypothetical protein
VDFPSWKSRTFQQASNKFGSLSISDNGKLVGLEGMLVATKIDLSDVSNNSG